jgi:hypothetical protein
MWAKNILKYILCCNCAVNKLTTSRIDWWSECDAIHGGLYVNSFVTARGILEAGVLICKNWTPCQSPPSTT